MSETCSYDELESVLATADAEADASECHGVLCGMICAAGTVDVTKVLDYLLGEGNALSAVARDCQHFLERLYADALLHLNNGEFELQLLLPDDGAPLIDRANALVQWCQGFLFGLGLGGVQGKEGLSGTINEIIRDFYEIAATRYDCETAGEVDESAYMEIIEYVRMSTLLIHEELQPPVVSNRLQ